MALFGDQFSRKSGKRQWRYVALVLEKHAKYAKNQYIWYFLGINFGDQFSGIS